MSSSEPVKESALSKTINDDNFHRFFRFGTIDSSILLVSLLAGVSVDAIIAKKIGIRGYGAILGACIGNIASDGLAALPEGVHASIGALCGSALPVLPVLFAMFSRKELTRNMRFLVGGSSIGLLGVAYGYDRFVMQKKADLKKSLEKHEIEKIEKQ